MESRNQTDQARTKRLPHDFPAVLLGLALILVMLVSACASPINRRNAMRYYEAGTAAEREGDLDAAREAYRRAMINIDLADGTAREKAYTRYELGRVTGYLCQHAEAERLLLESLQWQDRDPEVRAQLRLPTIFELARLYFDTGRLAEALPYYEEGISLTSELAISESDPIRFATILDELADCLLVVGREEEAAARRDESAALRRDNPDAPPASPFARYDGRCETPR